MKTYVIDKLFGGPHHGKVVVLSPRSSVYSLPRREKRMFTLSTDPVDIVVDAYTQRILLAPGRTIFYWAYYKASQERGREMLMNYLLRGARLVSDDGRSDSDRPDPLQAPSAPRQKSAASQPTGS
jgi:hypothetical protein